MSGQHSTGKTDYAERDSITVSGSSRRRLAQAIVILAALLVSVFIVKGTKTAPATVPTTFNMLAFLDERTALQEDAKDVRCWSSFCKLQMFITGVRIDDGAFPVRVDKHIEVIESIWDEAGREAPNASLISKDAVSSVLERRFSYQYEETVGATFQFSGDAPVILVDADALQDYSDTIEPWRLLQAWASRQADALGMLNKQPFDETALQRLYYFLRTYDLAILKHARRIAKNKKLPGVDAASMAEAFTLEGKLRN